MKAPTIDPLPATARKIRLLALRLLENVASTLSGDAIFRALRHHGVDEELVPPPKVVLDKKGNPVLPEEEEEEEETTEDEHTPLVLAGKRVEVCEDVWALLGGGAEKTRQMRNEEQPMAPGAWELLRTLVGVWEGEATRRSEAGGECTRVKFRRPNLIDRPLQSLPSRHHCCRISKATRPALAR